MEDKNFQMHNFINNPQMMLESSNRLPQENLQDLKSSYVAKWVWNCPSEGIAVKQPACTTETKYIVKASKELEYNRIVTGFWSSNSRAIFTIVWNKTKQKRKKELVRTYKNFRVTYKCIRLPSGRPVVVPPSSGGIEPESELL